MNIALRLYRINVADDTKNCQTGYCKEAGTYYRRKIGLGIPPFLCVTVSGQRFRLGNLKRIIEFGITKEA